jgi:allantoicase
LLISSISPSERSAARSSRQRRVLRGEGRLIMARRGVARRRIHRARQVDGRLGNARRARRRTETHDWCVIRLGARGIVRGVDVDTSFFNGNYPASCAIDACDLPGCRA